MVLIAAPSTVPAPPAVDGISSGGGRDRKQPAGFEGAAAAAWDLKAHKGW